ncbi:MAG TPA: GNAT family N-acetyltransferase, partial [Rectinemataceae bacterium]|nr:GNAT family N-acetyltransferase [Rectinemataceae bacterium]
RLHPAGIIRSGLVLLPLWLKWRELKCLTRLEDYAAALHGQSACGAHWVLYQLAVEPSRQRRGIGRELLKPVLEIADRDRRLCYLDTTNIVNVAFYERNAFKVVDKGKPPDGGPGFWSMVRDPQ